VAEFRAAGWRTCHGVGVSRHGSRIAALTGPFTFVAPHYDVLLDANTVYGRAEIYTSGPAPAAFNEPALDLALSTPGKILDFGCGSGVYVRELRARGRDAEGLEVDTDAVRALLAPDVRPHVRFYPGGFPIDLPDGSYDSCLAFEVLEHIPDFRAAIAELARIAREVVVVTVPDAGAIPRLFPHYAVPWHLLEGGHVNFFTQRSLHDSLAPHFARIEPVRICPHEVNGTIIYTSVAAICRKR
jgi:SAM-dependent methyltransferase